MRRVVRDPRWLAGLAVAVVFAVACVWLAQWQLDRRVDRAARNAAVLENYDSAPVPLPDVLTAVDDPLPLPEQWRPVTLRGTYDDAATVLVRNRPQDGAVGYLVATPFRLADPGPVERLLLVRGWLPAGSDASAPATVPAAPAGTVDVVARLRPAEPGADRTAPAGQAYRLDQDLLAGAAGPGEAAGSDGSDGGALRSAYGVVATEAGAVPAGLVPVPRPDTDPGPHLAYGVQWYLFALTGLVIWVVLARRHGADEGGDGATPGRDGRHGGGTGDRPGGRAGTRDGWVYEPGR